MTQKKCYRKRANQFITAIQLKLDTEGFDYQKWGAKQHCKKDDWLVNNNGDIYTIDADTFKKTYRQVETGHYVKESMIWAKVADHAGSIKTKEGESHYKQDDYIVFNNKDGTDGYCVSRDTFLMMYEPVED